MVSAGVGVFKASWQAMKPRLVALALGDGLVTVALIAGGAITLPGESPERGDYIVAGLWGLAFAIALTVVALAIFTLLVMPFQQRNQLRKNYDKLVKATTPEPLALLVDTNTPYYNDKYVNVGDTPISLITLAVTITNRGDRRVNLDPHLDFLDEGGAGIMLDTSDFTNLKQTAEAAGMEVSGVQWLPWPLVVEPDSTLGPGLLGFYVIPLFMPETKNRAEAQHGVLRLEDRVSGQSHSQRVSRVRFDTS